MTDEKKKIDTKSTSYPPETDDVDKRRQVVKKIAIGTGVALGVEKWVKPKVDSVILPAHAQATGQPPSPPGPPPPPSPPGPPSPPSPPGPPSPPSPPGPPSPPSPP